MHRPPAEEVDRGADPDSNRCALPMKPFPTASRHPIGIPPNRRSRPLTMAAIAWAAAGFWAASVAASPAPPEAAPHVPGLPRTAHSGQTASPPGASPQTALERLHRAGLRTSDVSLIARPVDGNGPALFELNADRPRVLASTAKVVTALAALDLLGPKHRWSTRAYLQGPLSDGVLRGNLVIVGGGNPTLTSQELSAWLRSMQKKGLREIHGDIILDRQAFRLTARDAATVPPENPDKPHHRWPEAFVVDKGRLQTRLSFQDGRVQLHHLPELAPVEVVDQLRRQNARCALRHSPDLDLESRPEGLRLVLKGDASPDCGPREIDVSTPSDSAFSRAALAGAWQAAGGFLSGRVIDGRYAPPRPAGKKRRSPPARPFSEHLSAPLPDILRTMDKNSDNVVARHVFLSMSQGFPSKPATLPEARSRVATWLQQQGLAAQDLHMDNGSGLSLAEQARPDALVRLLQSGWRQKHRQTFLQSLPVAGQDGTLAGRLRGTEAQGKAFLKTGTLQTASALAGYVRGRSGKTYAVAAVVNHPQAGRGVPALDAFIEWVAQKG